MSPLTGAWIETNCQVTTPLGAEVAPSQVRGLKLHQVRTYWLTSSSHPHGNVAVNIQCQPYWMGISFNGVCRRRNAH